MFGFDCSIHILLRLDLKNVHFQIAKKGMSRYVEIKHNGNDIVLCLASSVEQARSEHRGDPSLDLEQYESWTEVRDGTDSTNWELLNDALRSVAGGEELRNLAYRSKHSENIEDLSGKASESVAHVHSGTSQKTNDKHGVKVSTASIFQQPELMGSAHFKKSNKKKKVDEVEENNGDVDTAPTTVESGDRIQNGNNVSGQQGARQPAIDPSQSTSKPKEGAADATLSNSAEFRLAGKQHGESLKAMASNKTKTVEAADEAAKAGGAGGASNKKASDTSSSSSSDGPIAERTRSKTPRRSARLAEKK